MRRRLVARTFEVAAVLLGSLGTGLVLAGSAAGLQALALAVAAAVVVVAVEPDGALGRVPVGRTAVLTGAVVAQLSPLASRPVWPAAGLTACVLVGLLAGERLLLRVGKVRAPVVAHLPGLLDLPPEPALDHAVVLGALAARPSGSGAPRSGGRAGGSSAPPRWPWPRPGSRSRPPATGWRPPAGDACCCRRPSRRTPRSS